ncbi:hypothetical protein SLEP1_g50380 [Rubroshorea leprosula]|uniref:Uncharacterized protein n=1 Tax=Rubroshorea leprosula TaxID=152421 RepID=A0AAV5LZT4_9ROSI|nr:hypothetical protein SLEP1_g50380 [Rubroshorea leprosula]
MDGRSFGLQFFGYSRVPRTREYSRMIIQYVYRGQALK